MEHTYLFYIDNIPIKFNHNFPTSGKNIQFENLMSHFTYKIVKDIFITLISKLQDIISLNSGTELLVKYYNISWVTRFLIQSPTDIRSV